MPEWKGPIAKFDRNNSWFPTEGHLDDKFNDDFVLYTIITNVEKTIPAGGYFFGVKWKSKNIILGTNSTPITEDTAGKWRWREIPTIADLLKLFGEELPKETTTYSYSWITGFIINENGEIDPNGQYIYVTDEWKTNLLVIVEGFDWTKWLAITGIGIAGVGLIAIIGKSRAMGYARRAGEYAREYASKVKGAITR